MSAPSWAVFIKDGKNVDSCFVNCGWWQDDPSTLRQIIEYLDKNPVDFDQVIAYGVTYSNDLEFELLKAIEFDSKWRELNKAKRERLWEASGHQNVIVTFPVKRVVPTLIAEEICGVQPMTGHTSKIYSMKAVYIDDISC